MTKVEALIFKKVKVPDPNKLRFISCGSLVGMGLGSLINFPWWLSLILIVLGIMMTFKANPYVDLK